MLKKDYYEFINKKWLTKAKIKPDKVSISAFQEIILQSDIFLKKTTKNWTENQDQIPDFVALKEYVKYYQLLLDKNRRKKESWSVAKKYYDQILNLKSYEEIFMKYENFSHFINYLPVNFSVGEDFKNNVKQVLWMSEAKTILPSKNYYQKPEKRKLLDAWALLAQKVLASYGISKRETEIKIKNTLFFDEIISQNILSEEQKADYVKNYHVLKLAKLTAIFESDKVVKLIRKIIKKPIDFVVTNNQNFYKNWKKIYSKKNFFIYRDYLFTRNLVSVSSQINEKLRKENFTYSQLLTGAQKMRNLKDYSFDIASKLFGNAIGLWYGKNFFGNKAKKNIETMIAKMMDVYQKQINDSEWLSPQTKKKAILKLKNLVPMIGFPKKIHKFFSIIKIDLNNSLFVNNLQIEKIFAKLNYQEYGKEPDKKLWQMSAHEVNAYFHPIKNQIVFPAGILTKPFYDVKRNSSANYGGIGAIIAHEISHAFDNNGSQFDENGKVKNWWTKEDHEKFQLKIEQTIKLFEGIETEAGKINGRLTVSENIADIVGFNCALQAAKTEKDFDLEKFFKSWATIWRSKYRLETAKILLTNDVHAPAKQRANINLKNCEEFNEFYNLTPADEMFLEPKKRVKIW